MQNFHLYLQKIGIIRKEIHQVYLNLMIETFALSLISIFVPIYLLNLGFSLNEALAFILVEYTTLSFFTPVSVKLAQKFGFKHIIIYRIPLLAAYVAGLYALESIQIPIYAIALAGGISGSMYWASLHSLFAKYSEKVSRESQAGNLVSLPKIASLVGPAFGGFAAAVWGFSALFALSALFIIISIIPLFFTGDMKPAVKKVDYRKVFLKSNLKFFTRFAAQGAIMIMGPVLWPLFVYFATGDIALTGIVGTITSLGTIAASFAVPRISRRIGAETVMRLGGILVALTFILQIFSESVSRIIFVSFVSGLFIVAIDVPLIAAFYDKANDEDNIGEAVIFRQMGLGIGRLVSVFILFWVAQKFASGFGIGAAASLLFSLI